ncbi:hypothetical protein VTK73DRAFT_6836 [Phialemonium thermophilum]|uniref:Uncharacterized protein n=1 Tax=Phialemonium thermophilum TaxID=223376 RepID=A0ABR3Y8I9_9PEZI
MTTATTGLGVKTERNFSTDAAHSPFPRTAAVNLTYSRAVTVPSDASSTVSNGINMRSRAPTGDLGDPLRLFSANGTREPAPASMFELEHEPGSIDDLEFLPLTSPAPDHPTRTNSEDVILSVQDPLPHEFFTESDLVEHLRRLDDSNTAAAIALDDLWDRRAEMAPEDVIPSLKVLEDDTSGSRYTNATYEVYDVLRDGSAVRQYGYKAKDNDDGVEAATAWDTIKEVNPQLRAVGRITILQEPSPLMLGATHMTMAKHFDMDELLMHLVTTDGNKGKTKAYVNRAFETSELRRRTFFFVFKYYTVVEEGLVPAPWQQYDQRPPAHRSADHIDIAECGSVLALSLQGPHLKVVEGRNRRTRRNGLKGYVYDPFAPWHLLSIQSYPDNEHTLRSEDDDGKRFINGPYAFLDALAAEYRDAVKRYTRLNELITKLITPPSEFMFNVKLRDNLLFEDQYFTYTRRYFWGYNTLGVINEGIKSMKSAYMDTFTDDFWAGRHQTIWPHPRRDSAEGCAYEFKMSSLRQELERAVSDLHAVLERNGKTRSEIRSLREQLFSGSSVKESRRAIEQGDNIKILTSVSMLFLPLTFVTVFIVDEDALRGFTARFRPRDWE